MKGINSQILRSKLKTLEKRARVQASMPIPSSGSSENMQRRFYQSMPIEQLVEASRGLRLYERASGPPYDPRAATIAKESWRVAINLGKPAYQQHTTAHR